MLTRCPACATHFRITPAQLKVRSGSVRCGACQHVFNALDSLIEEPLGMPAPRAPESMQAGLDAAPAEPEVDAAVHPEDRCDDVAVTCPRSGFPGTQSEPAPTLDPTAEALDELISAPEPVAEEAPAQEPAATTDFAATADAADWSESFPAPPPPPRRWPWLLGSLVALAALAVQALLAFRVELAVLWPEVRPSLVALCDIPGCEVGLPAKVGLVGIEASDLHPDSAHPGRLALSATLKNRAPFAQQFPLLELTLTDTADKAVARKVLTAADYLPAQTSVAQGMPPNADIVVAVGVDAGTLAASGYRLYLFYP